MKDRSISPDRNYTTKIRIGVDDDIRRDRVIQYSDDDDTGRYHIRPDRSLSPEVRPMRQQQQQQQRIRNGMASPKPIQRKQLSSTRLIQEAERGRNVGTRRPEAGISSSRLVQQAYRAEAIQPEPPVAPIRTKKLRERMEASPPRADRSGMRVGFNANVDSIPPRKQPQQQQHRWMRRKDSESSRERSSSPQRRADDFRAEFQGSEGYVYAPRYHPASVDPRFLRRYHPEEEDEAEMDNVRLG